MPSTTSVGPTPSRSDEAPRTSPTKLTRTSSTSSAGVGTRAPRGGRSSSSTSRSRPARVVEQGSASRRPTSADRPRARSGPSAAPQVGHQRRERAVRVGEQPSRHGEAAAAERVRERGAPARRVTTRTRRRRSARSASARACASGGCVAAEHDRLDRCRSARLDDAPGRAPPRPPPALKAPCSTPERARPRSGAAGAARRTPAPLGRPRASSLGSATRSWPTATAWMTYGAGRSPPDVTTAVPGAIGPCSTAARSIVVAPVALHRRGGAGGHEQRLARRDDHDGVDLELGDVPLPDVDLDRFCHGASAPALAPSVRPRGGAAEAARAARS